MIGKFETWMFLNYNQNIETDSNNNCAVICGLDQKDHKLNDWVYVNSVTFSEISSILNLSKGSQPVSILCGKFVTVMLVT